MDLPENYGYTNDHEWADIKEAVATIGITHHAQEALGEIVFVELPEVGRELQKGDTFGVVESIKAVSDLYSPLSGKVVEINQNIVDNPANINEDPQGSAWMIKLELSQPSEKDELMSANDYKNLVDTL